MRIGVFDSGVGGLLMLRSIIKKLPRYSYVYLGDTAHMPYGDRSRASIYKLTRRGVDFLFKKGCALVILACNTASAQALRRIQREFLPRRYPGRRVLGVVVPTVEAVCEDGQARRVGVIATLHTVRSRVYIKELKKIAPRLAVAQEPAPLLAPLIEHDGARFARPVVRAYLQPLLRKKIDTLILGSTHYPLLKTIIRREAGPGVRLISQDEIIPRKLKEYLERHPEIEKRLEKRGACTFYVTERTPHIASLATRWFWNGTRLKKVVV